MDWEAWWTWEACAVRLIAGAEDPTRALAALRLVVEDVRTWRPGEGALGDRIQRSFDRVSLEAAVPTPAVAHDGRLREVLEAIPPELRPEPSPFHASTRRAPAHIVRNFLAAHAFANWTAHLGEGLRTWLRAIEAAFALLELGYGVRDADLLLRHLADPYRLARVWSAVEA
jgi:hypothetical protein